MKKTIISPRELTVLELISREYTSEEIAQEMFISPHTALTHRKNLLSKLNARNTAGLVRIGFETKLLRITACFLMMCISILGFSQDIKLEVEGLTKMRGNVDINSSEDSTSIYIGRLTGNSEYDPLVRKYNVVVGLNAGSDMTDAFNNSLFGYQAGKGITTGYDNSAFGSESGERNDVGYQNSFFGSESGQLNESGIRNSFFGFRAGEASVTGDRNTFLGHTAGQGNGAGSSNVYIGDAAGIENDGSFNVYLGSLSGNSVATDTRERAIAIGYNAKVACDFCAVIGGEGNESVNVGIGTNAPTTKLHINGDEGAELLLEDIGSVATIRMKTENSLENWIVSGKSHSTLPIAGQTEEDAAIIFQYGQDSIFRFRGNGDANMAGTLTENSDIRLKKNINRITNILPQLMALNGYTYNWKDKDKNTALQVGLIAQEVQAQFPELVQVDEKGKLSVSYTRFVPLLIEGLKEQEERIAKLEKLVEKLIAK